MPHSADLADRFRAFVADGPFPCVGAKAAMARGGLTLVTALSLTAALDDGRILSALVDFVTAYRQNPGPFHSFAVLFDGPPELSEAGFEAALWARLQALASPLTAATRAALAAFGG